MSEFKGTPGPWSPSVEGVPEVGVYGFGYRVALMTSGEINRDRANAHLIAAAPNSHKANDMFVEAMNELCGISPAWSDDRIYDELPSSGLALAYFAARDAIAKATGASA